MQKIFELWRRLLFLRRRGGFDRELEEEMRFHLQMRIEENVTAGMAPDEALRAAGREFGNRASLREASKEEWGFTSVEAFSRDLRYALRGLARNPGYAAVVVATLALGVGANTAVFSVVNAVLLRPLPYRDAPGLVVLWERDGRLGRERNVTNPANFLKWQTLSESFESMAAFYDSSFTLTGAGEPAGVPVQVASVNMFAVLGADAMLGRTLRQEDAEPGRTLRQEDAEPGRTGAVVISHGLWRERFGGSRDAVGRTVELNGQPVTVVGVMPPDFKWFVKENSLRGRPAAMWVPTKLTPQTPGRFLSVVGRLRPGVGLEEARNEMNAIAARLERERPDLNTGWGVTLVPVREQLAAELKTPLLVLFGAVAFLLAIACANVANLTLARTAWRSKEIAVRAALGASRMRVGAQLLTENILLSAAGGLLGLATAAPVVGALAALSPPNLIEPSEVRVSLPVLAFTFAVSLLTGVVSGLLPAIEASRYDPNEALRGAGRGGTAGPRWLRLRGAFVVTQVALALVLLVGAGLMTKSLARLRSIDPGFDPQNLLTARVEAPAANYRGDEQAAFFRRAVERIEKLPGVISAAAVSSAPFADIGATTKFSIEGRAAPAAGEELVTDVRVTDENYFRTMGIAVVAGRGFTREEATERRRTIIVNEAFAQEFFPGESPIGRRIKVEMEENPPAREIVGVVGDALYAKLEAGPFPMVYETPSELPYDSMFVVARTAESPLSFAPAVRREIQALEPGQPAPDVRTMESWMGDSTARARFGALLLAAFAVIALLLASTGIYGVVSYSVAQRTHEIGVRMALGAEPGDVLRLVVRQGLRPTLAGIGLGLVGAFALTRVISGLLFRVSTTDPVTFAGVILLLTATSLLACVMPARRATKVDPAVALRAD